MKWVQSIVDLLLMLVVGVWLLWIFLGVPPAQTAAGGWAQKIFYLHVPAALVGFFGFFLVALCALGVLLGDERTWDIPMCATIEVSYLYACCVLLTGPFWAKPVWGIWWRWEPRLTTFFVMWLMYGAWFLLRRSIPEGTQQKIYSAIYAVLAFFNVPVVMSSIYMWQPARQLHPQREDLSMEPIMHYTFYVSIGVALVVFMRLVWFRFDLERLRRKVRRSIRG
jgi:heme exporter protein C